MHTEDHRTHKLAELALKQVAKKKLVPYNRIKSLFIRGNEKIAKNFWIELRKIEPSHPYDAVYCCPGCKKFDLEYEGLGIPW
ncbi:MAG: hypothetical protein GTO02_13155 [Candidatus Dadabacteria bacterium]|nr:hypothetical protein [Candidatus Dadabacteria bacterium]